MGLSLVAWKRLSSAIYVPFTASSPGRTLPLPGHKADTHQKLATSPISCISLPSRVFFLNLVKGNYNIELSLFIYFPSTPSVVKNTVYNPLPVGHPFSWLHESSLGFYPSLLTQAVCLEPDKRFTKLSEGRMKGRAPDGEGNENLELE